MELTPSGDDYLVWGFTITFFVFCFVQLFWMLFFYIRIAFHKHKPGVNLPPVSVVIAARNEADNLFKHLPSILEQKYPKFEVIVVNHQSMDESSAILKAFARKYPHLKIIELAKNPHLKNGKKLPLTVGIKGAKYEHLLFTDADCAPSSSFWIEQMAGKFSTKHEIVLGYGPYFKEKGNLNKVIRLDTALIALNYLSYAKAGTAYMGVGRNLGYSKSLFLDNKGFKSHYSIQSGDDDLFIQEVAKNRNYTVCIKENAFCFSKAENSWEDWHKQKGRHFTTAEFYTIKNKLLLGIYPLSLILMYTNFIILCLNNWLCILTISIFSLIMMLKWFIQGKALTVLKEKDFIIAFPLWELFHTLLMPIIYYTSEKSSETKWK